ncbi:MAG: anthranilate synthase component I [Bacillaceae bacterium]|nr:anthranilate synthase component I [Bacillaceae bacterium]
MYYPHIEEVIRLSSDFNMIPVSCSFLADVETPISVYQKLKNHNTFLLESVEGGSKWARFSFIGIDPLMTFSGKDERILIRDNRHRVTEKHGNPLHELRKQMQQYASPLLPELPRFTGGAVGYLGFDVIRYEENRLAAHPDDDLNMHDLRFLFTDTVVAFDHLYQKIFVIKNIHIEQDDDEQRIRQKYDRIQKEIQELVRRIKRPVATLADYSFLTPDHFERGAVRSSLDQTTFEQMVEKAKAYIDAGDVFQVVLSRRFEQETDVDPFAVYRMLRSMNPSPYMFYVQYDDEVLVGTSPEMLVRVENRKVEVRPIAGTRRRGTSPEEDHGLAEDLLQDEKERAEHLMLVDLGRNDVGRVSEYGSVHVDQLMEVEYYSHVMHLVSQVSGTLKNELDPFDALLAGFPAGTVSGAPKIRAIEIIHELENKARHAYAGAIGYFSFNGNLDSCITIRTIIFKDNKAYVQAGAGIVADSVPEKEFEETRNKAEAMLKAIHQAEIAFGAEVENHAG